MFGLLKHYCINLPSAGSNINFSLVLSQEIEVLSLFHLYSLKTKISQCHYNDIMRFSVLGYRSDIRSELQAPVVLLTPLMLICHLHLNMTLLLEVI